MAEQTNRRLGASSPKNITEMKKEIGPLNTELGLNTQLPFSTPFSGIGVKGKTPEKDLEELLREEFGQGPSVEQLRQMRITDGQARALYRLLTLPIRSAVPGCTFVAAEDGEEEAEFIRLALLQPPRGGGMSIPFSRVIAQLLQALFDGFAAFEKVYWIPSQGPLKGKLTLQKLGYRPSDTVNFIVDKEGSFRGFRQRTYAFGQTKDVYIPKARAFYYAAQEDENPYYGVSYFQSAYYHWDKKVKTYFIAHLAAQRSAVGTRVGVVPRNASTQAKNEFARNVSNMATNQYLLMPEGFTMDSLKEGGNFDFLSYLNHHNSQMSKSILGHFIDKDQGAGKNESSVIDNNDGGGDFFYMVLGSIMSEIADQINHYLIPDLIDANFKGQKYPKFVWGKLTDDQKKRIAHVFEKLSTGGESVNVTPEFLRELEKSMADELGFDIDYEEIEKREEEEREKMEEQMQAEQQQAAAGDLQSLEAAQLEGDDEMTLSSTEAGMLRLAASYLDDAWRNLDG